MSNKARDTWAAFDRAFDSAHEERVRTAERCSKFYLGDQWDPDVRKALEDEGRPALTINLIMQAVQSVMSLYSQNQVDITYKPRTPDVEDTAHVLSRIVDGILENNKYHTDVEPQVVQDGVVEGMGYFDIRLDFDKNEMGEIAISSLEPRSVVLDPDAKEYDPRTWNEVFVERWMAPTDIEDEYGEDVLNETIDNIEMAAPSIDPSQVRFGSGGFGSGAEVMVDEETRRTVRSIRVVERQHKRMRKISEFVDLETGDVSEVPADWSEEQAEAFADRMDLIVRKVRRKQVYWTVVAAGRTVIHADWSPYKEFTIVPYFPFFRRGAISGYVQQLLSPQEQLNKLESQKLHVINTTANSGWIVEAGSLQNMTLDELEQNGAKSGLVISYNRNTNNAPEKIQPNQIPSGLTEAAQASSGYVQQISGVAALSGGIPSSEVSGVTLQRQQSQAVAGLQPILDNLTRTRQILAERILDLIQSAYTEHRIFRVTDWSQPEPQDEQVEINVPDAAENILNDVSLGTYDVVVSSQPARDNFEETQFAKAMQMREAGVVIPDYHVIMTSDLANKRQIAEEAKQLQGLGEPTEAQRMQQEMQLQEARAKLQEIQARVEKYQADSTLSQARAQTEVASEMREAKEQEDQVLLELQKQRQDLMKQILELENKLQLAEMHSERGQAETRYKQVMSSLTADKDRRAKLQEAALGYRSEAQ